jgi:RNA polymerase subunit RPABC4/transcription elongation factor Spt4
MATKEKACLNCKVIFSEERCPICNETAFSDSWKGRIYIFNAEKSEVAKNMKINKNGLFTIKVK